MKKPKMDYFEAWRMANYGDKLWHGSCYTIKKHDGLICWENMHGKPGVLQYRLFEKEWTIEPQKKTVEIDIPEGAKDVTVEWGENYTTSYEQKVKKITYKI